MRITHPLASLEPQEAHYLAAIGIRVLVCHDHATQLQADLHMSMRKLSTDCVFTPCTKDCVCLLHSKGLIRFGTVPIAHTAAPWLL